MGLCTQYGRRLVSDRNVARSKLELHLLGHLLSRLPPFGKIRDQGKDPFRMEPCLHPKRHLFRMDDLPLRKYEYFAAGI